MTKLEIEFAEEGFYVPVSISREGGGLAFVAVLIGLSLADLALLALTVVHLIGWL